MDIRGFLEANNLKQVDLARYLGVSESAVSSMINGKSKPSKGNLIKMINNPHGWNVSMLVEESNSMINNQSGTHIGGNNTVTMSTGNCVLEKENASLRKENELLRSQLEKIEAEKQEYWEMIKRLTAK